MKAIISMTYSDTYLYFLPITTFLWNKLGVDVICFMPRLNYENDKKYGLVQYYNWLHDNSLKNCQVHFFDAPEHKQATYAQCSRLYGACLDLPEDEVLCIGDVDMGVFNLNWLNNGLTTGNDMTILGADLVPEKQIPMCYISGDVKEWRNTFELHGKTYQQCLDELLGDIECESFRGNYWGKDQETAYKMIDKNCSAAYYLDRSNGQNQFAQNRYDRDDSYILDRLNPDTIDFHMNRPGFEDGNFNIILTILKYHYPNEDFTWLINYTNEYRKLL